MVPSAQFPEFSCFLDLGDLDSDWSVWFWIQCRTEGAAIISSLFP